MQKEELLKAVQAQRPRQPIRHHRCTPLKDHHLQKHRAAAFSTVDDCGPTLEPQVPTGTTRTDGGRQMQSQPPGVTSSSSAD